jgi:hypothetical protein
MPEKYFVEDGVEDLYIDFETSITADMLPGPRWVRAVEFRPGSSAVHHIIAPPLGGIAPGNDPTIYRDGYGVLLEPGSTVYWQMHYHKEPGPGTGVWDQSMAAIKFYPEGYAPDYVIQNAAMGNLWFEIPAGDPNYSARVSYTFERPSKVLSYLPHAHLRGKSAKYVAYYPDGTEEVLLHVPRYDFNWQTRYRYREEKLVPAGTRVELTMVWDNSANNPYNPDPTRTVYFGRPTTDEMMFGFMGFADAEPGYVPESRQWFGRGRGLPGGVSSEQIQDIVRERLGIDLDSLTPEERRQLMQRFLAARRRAAGDGE